MSNLQFSLQLYYVHTLFKVFPDWQGDSLLPFLSLAVSPQADPCVGSAMG
jgi:hypothetical protein